MGVNRPSAASILAWSAAPQMVAHQIGWWACVLWMGWHGPLVMVAFIVIHFYMTRREFRAELLLAIVSTLVGIIVDNSLFLFGAVEYVGELTIGYSPVWLVAIWSGFGVTLRHHQSLFVRKWIYALLVGVLGGPLAYLGGVKLARLTVNDGMGWVCVSLTWTMAMLVLYWTVRHVGPSLQSTVQSPATG